MSTANYTLSSTPASAYERTRELLSGVLSVPFDAMRAQYAAAARAGLVQCSILRGREVERAIRSLEAIALGPLARQL